MFHLERNYYEPVNEKVRGKTVQRLWTNELLPHEKLSFKPQALSLTVRRLSYCLQNLAETPVTKYLNVNLEKEVRQ
jgi:hypothetical protein